MLAAEELVDQGVAREAMMQCDVTKNGGECSNPQLIVVRNGDVMLLGFVAGEPNVASGPLVTL